MVALIGILGAVAGLGLGVLGLVWPHRALRLVGLALDPLAPHGVSEVRATYGGLFMGMEAAVLLAGEPRLYLVPATAWIGAAMARSVSIVTDQCATRENAGGIVVELGIGLAHAARALL